MNERIRKLRKSLDLTQREFADRIGVKQNTVAQYEMGRNIPIDSIISLICREFNVNEEWLRNGTGEMFMEQDEEDMLMEWAGRVLAGRPDSFKKRFMKAMMTLSEDEWVFVERKAREILGLDEDEELEE